MRVTPTVSALSSGSTDPVLDLRSAAFGYAERMIITDIDLTVHPGEVVAVLGPNGSGKSTLVKGLVGLAQHTAGEVRLFGEPLDHVHDRWRLGYVPQRHTLATSLRTTVGEVVGVGRVAHTPWWAPWRAGSAENKRLIAQSLSLVGLGDQQRTDVTTLSGGQQRRVLIARALAAQPEAILMDEPTAGVDRANQQVLGEVLTRLAAAGRTMVIVTHELEAIRPAVTRAVAIDSGRIIYDGPPDAIDTSITGHVHHHHDDDDDTAGVGAPTLTAPHPMPPVERPHA